MWSWCSRYLSSVGNRYPVVYVASYVGRKSEVRKCRQRDLQWFRLFLLSICWMIKQLSCSISRNIVFRRYSARFRRIIVNYRHSRNSHTLKFSMKSLNFSCFLCALNLHFAESCWERQNLLEVVRTTKSCCKRQKLLKSCRWHKLCNYDVTMCATYFQDLIYTIKKTGVLTIVILRRYNNCNSRAQSGQAWSRWTGRVR